MKADIRVDPRYALFMNQPVIFEDSLLSVKDLGNDRYNWSVAQPNDSSSATSIYCSTPREFLKIMIEQRPDFTGNFKDAFHNRFNIRNLALKVELSQEVGSLA